MLGSVSFGTWKLASDSVDEAVAKALRMGFRSIDTAAAYANERDVGRGLKSSEIARDSLFVSGKLWITRRTYDAAMKACKKSLRNLGLDYFDQYLIHWPASPALHDDAESLNAETWGALEDLVTEGLSELMKHATVAPCVNQIEMHPGHLPKSTIRYCFDAGIGVEAWSPLGHGTVLNHPLICQVANDSGCSPAQVCLKWVIERGATPIVGASSEEHMREALDTDTVELPYEDLQIIDEMESCGFSGMTSEADAI